VVKEDKQHLIELFEGLSDEDIDVLTRSFAQIEANVRTLLASGDPSVRLH